MKFWTLAIFSG